MDGPDGPNQTQSVFPTGNPLDALRSGWRRQWQAPALLAGAGLLVGGLAVGLATRPGPDLSAPLARAEALVAREQYQQALDVLNAGVLPYLGTEELSRAEEGRFHLAVARSVWRWQQVLGIENETNSANVVRSYGLAEDAGGELLPEDRKALAMALMSLGRHGDALATAELIPPERRDLRVAVYRESVDRRLGRRGRDVDGALALLSKMLTDPELPLDDRVWALARQSDIMLERGFAHEVVTRLLRELPRVERQAGAEALGGLFLRLGRAYLEDPAVDEAGKQLERADRLLPEGSPLRAAVLYYRGRVHELRGETGEARDLYAQVVSRHAQSEVYARALAGMGEMDAAQRMIPEALESYEQAAKLVREDPAGAGLPPAALTGSLLARFAERMIEGEADAALRFAGLAESLWSAEQTPPEVLEAIGRGNQVRADQLLGGEGDGALDITPAELARVDPGTRREAQRCLVRAGYAFRRHADRYAVTDPGRYAGSLWASATAYDLAGDIDEAIGAFRQYVTDLPSEGRHPEARYRLGRAYQAKGEYSLAAQAFEQLISEAKDGLNPNARPWADASLVPLAQALLADEDRENDARAVELLGRVLSGEAGGAETEQFRAALHEAAGMHLRRGEFRRAAERYEEILGRYPGEDGEHLVRFRLAEAYRRLADERRAELDSVMRDGDRRAIAQERSEWLARALTLYDEARAAIERIPAGRRTGLEETCLRNAYFYRGDCAFDLGDYTAAIRYYSAAKDRYAQEPASLVALVQIVNAYIRLDDVASAQTANNRARLFFESLPDSVWDDPDLPMSRADWERWLDSTEILESRMGSVASGGSE